MSSSVDAVTPKRAKPRDELVTRQIEALERYEARSNATVWASRLGVATLEANFQESE
jgi:hypothetical protein